MLDDLLPLLRTIQPAKLNATLGALATALEGRGERAGRQPRAGRRYFTRLNPELPAIKKDIRGLADVSQIYADAAPDLVRMLRNFAVTTSTIKDKSDGATRASSPAPPGFADDHPAAAGGERRPDHPARRPSAGRRSSCSRGTRRSTPACCQGLAQSNDFIGKTFANGELHITLEVDPGPERVRARARSPAGASTGAQLLRPAEPAAAVAGQPLPGRHPRRRQPPTASSPASWSTRRAVSPGTAEEQQRRRRPGRTADGRAGRPGARPRHPAVRADGPRDGGGAVVKTTSLADQAGRLHRRDGARHRHCSPPPSATSRFGGTHVLPGAVHRRDRPAEGRRRAHRRGAGRRGRRRRGGTHAATGRWPR